MMAAGPREGRRQGEVAVMARGDERREMDRRESGEHAASLLLDRMYANRKSDPAGYRAARGMFEAFTGRHAGLKVGA